MALNSRAWTDQPDGRGTFDILKTCCGTIALLCWSSVCPNIPSLKSGRWTSLTGKLQLFLLAVLGPDFVFMVALGQLNNAWNLRKKSEASKDARSSNSSWSLRQCFFINMGGIHVKFADQNDQDSTFPVDGEQLLFLIEKGFVVMPSLDDDDIEEKNKTDELGRSIAILQCIWFVISSFGRVSQGLHLTTLEITTLAFIFLMSACVVIWWRKPMDIRRPITIESRESLSDAIARAAETRPTVNTQNGNTPLSFYNRREWFLSLVWSSYIQLLRTLRLLPPKKPPLTHDHFPSIDFLPTQTVWEFAAGPLIIAYSAIFMSAWNNQFPTHAERMLWRTASMICLLYGVLGCAVASTWHNGNSLSGMVGNKIKPILHRTTSPRNENGQVLPLTQRDESNQTENEQCPAPKTSETSRGKTCNCHLFGLGWARSISGRFNFIRNMSPDKDPALTMSLHAWAITTLLCMVYLFSRSYILIEDFVGLRELPASTFQTVDWGQYAPVLG